MLDMEFHLLYCGGSDPVKELLFRFLRDPIRTKLDCKNGKSCHLVACCPEEQFRLLTETSSRSMC